MHASRSALRSLPLFVCFNILVPIRDVVAAKLQWTPLPTRSCETNDLFPRCIVDPCTNVAIFIFHNLLYKHLYQDVNPFFSENNQKTTWQLGSGVFTRRCPCSLTNGQPSLRTDPRVGYYKATTKNSVQPRQWRMENRVYLAPRATGSNAN